jgi:hypothetical protein
MEKIMNFERMELNGATKQEALEQAPFTIQRDVTQSYKNWKEKQVGGITSTSEKQFMLDFLQKNTKYAPGLGFCITLEPAVADTRERPYSIVNVKGTGTRVKKKIYQFFDKATGQLIAETKAVKEPVVDKETKEPVLNEDGTPKMHWRTATKSEAMELGRSLYTKKGFKGDLVVKAPDQVVEGEPIAFEMYYTPSKNARTGRYLVFGIKNS